MSFVLFVIWEIISQGPIKPWTFSRGSQVIFRDWLLLPVMLCLPSKALYPWTTKQVSLRFTCSIFWELFRNSRTKCPHIQQMLNHKTIKRLRPWFFCVSTFPEIEEYKISVPWTFNKKIKKLLFLPSKMGGRLIHGIDLYTGKYGNRDCNVKWSNLKGDNWFQNITFQWLLFASLKEKLKCIWNWPFTKWYSLAYVEWKC